MSKQEQFCKQWCGPLTNEQRVVLANKVECGEFLGVGRPCGGMQFMPMVLIGKTPNVIDKAGYYQLAAIDGRRGYVPNDEKNSTQGENS